MKTIQTLLLLIFLTACTKTKEKVIISKSHLNYFENQLPVSICRFYYDGNDLFDTQFTDSCHFYKIGDTLK
jgi:hypothetical protein